MSQATLSGPSVPALEPVERNFVRLGRRKLVNFGGCDYFRLAWEPEVREAVASTARDRGHNFAASRRTTGNHPLYLELEAALAKFAGMEAAILASSGYLAPLVAVQGLAVRHTHVLVDARAHGSLQDAAVNSRLPLTIFEHGDAVVLKSILRKLGRRARALVLCDGLSAPLGTLFSIREYLAAMPASATLVVDDAHGFFLLGKRGRGTLEHLGVTDDRVVLTTTLSKALGAFGGVVLGSRQLRDQILTDSRAFAGSSPVSPALAAGALSALELLRRRGSRLRRQLQTNVDVFRWPQNLTGVPVHDHVGPMFSHVASHAAAERKLSQRLLAAGIYPTLIGYGGGPASKFFRFAVSSDHTPEQLESLRCVLAESLLLAQPSTSSK